MLRGLAAQKLERMRQRRLDQLEAVAAAARGAWESDDERLAPHARDAAAEQTVRSLGGGGGTKGLRNSGHTPVEDGLRRLRSEVARRDPGAAGRQNEPRLPSELAKGCGDLRTLVGHDAVLDLVLLGLEQLDE